MRFSHRALAVLCALLLCLLGGATHSPLFAVPVIAEAAEPLQISAMLVPDEFVVPEEAQLTLELTNSGSHALEAVCLTRQRDSLVESIGDIAPGASVTYSRTHMLTQEELNAGRIEYTVSCLSGKKVLNYPISVAIERLSAAPKIEFMRQVSNSNVSDGGGVTVLYTLKNVGNIAVNAVSIADPLGNFEGRLETLDVGEHKVFLQHISLTEDAVSAPTLTYSLSDSEVYTATLDDLPITMATGMLDASITAGCSIFAPDVAEVVLQLSNRGNLDYTEITIFDDVYGGVIADSISIRAGHSPVEVAHSYPLRQDSTYRWRIMGKTSAGEQIDFVTNTVSVELDEAPGDPLLTVKASTSMSRISRKGYVPIRLELHNVGGAMAMNVSIREVTAGEVRNLTVVPTGDATICEILHEVTQNTSLTFSAVYTDRQGQERIATAAPIEITIGAGGQMPMMDKHGSMPFDGLAAQMHNRPLFIALSVSVCLVLALLVALIILSSRSRTKRKVRAAAIRKRKKEDLAKTASFIPIRKKNKLKK